MYMYTRVAVAGLIQSSHKRHTFETTLVLSILTSL